MDFWTVGHSGERKAGATTMSPTFLWQDKERSLLGISVRGEPVNFWSGAEVCAGFSEGYFGSIVPVVE